jgi:hypothetical protein
MTSFLMLILCILAFACLAFAMERHQDAAFGRILSRWRIGALRMAGWSGLCLTLAIMVASEGWAVGLVRYSGITSLAAGLIYATLIMIERRGTRRS